MKGIINNYNTLIADTEEKTEIETEETEELVYVNISECDPGKYTKKKFDELVMRMRSGDKKESEKAKNEIAEFLKKYVMYIAKSYFDGYIHSYDAEIRNNIMQAGFLGVFTGLQQYNPKYWSDLISIDYEYGHVAFLKPYIIKEMTRYISFELNEKSPYFYENIKNIQYSQEYLKNKKEPLTVENISAVAELPQEVVENCLILMRNSDKVSIDEMYETMCEMGTDLENPEGKFADRGVMLSELDETLADAFSVLTEEELFVITHLFAIHAEEMSLDEIADYTGKSKEHIKYIRQHAIKKLHKNTALAELYAA